jgi:hypothetical protein
MEKLLDDGFAKVAQKAPPSATSVAAPSVQHAASPAKRASATN